MARRHIKRAYSKVAAVHRTLQMSAHFIEPQQGDDVKVLQRAVNARRSLTGDAELKVDGLAGRDTIAKARRMYVALGGALSKPGVTKTMQLIIRHPNLRTPVQLARAKRYRREHPPQTPVEITANTATGGANVRQRVVAVAMEAAHMCAIGKRPRRYSQAGGWTVSYAITGEPKGKRTDCSQWVTSAYKSAGGPDPSGANFTGGNTDTMAAHMREIRRDALRPGDDVIYFAWGRSHHTEKWVGNGDGKTSYAALDRAKSPYRDRTVGHGSPPVDFGDIDMMAGARFFTCLP